MAQEHKPSGWKKDQEKNEEERLSKIHKGFVWYSVSTLLWIIIFLFVYDWLFVKNEELSTIIALICVILSLPLFILAIIHLDIYKKEGIVDVILALIISGIVIGAFLFGLADNTDSIPSTADSISSNQDNNPIEPSNINVEGKIKENIVYVRYEFTAKNKDGRYFEGEKTGSGVILFVNNSEMDIFTNRHVIDCGFTEDCYQRLSEKITVRTQDGKTHNVQKVLIPPHNLDLGILLIETGEDYKASLLRLNNLILGEEVTAIGYPGLEGINNILEFSVSKGKITNIRDLLTRDGFSFQAIDSDAYANFGSSGGGVFDSYGNLVGITTWKTGTQENIAITAKSIKVISENAVNQNNQKEKFTFCEQGNYIITYKDENFCLPYCDRDEVLGEDKKCYELCKNFYCKSDNINGEDSRCDNGYILGKDDYCHPACGSKITYCPDINSICYKNSCTSNCKDEGKELFKDGTCRYYQ